MKIQIMAPALALGSAVHTVLESLSVKPTHERFSASLQAEFASVWKNFQGEKGGFSSKNQEAKFIARGEKMLKNVIENPGPLEKLAVKIKAELPQYWLSEEDEIMLSGKIDWLEYDKERDGVTIIDFKTGSGREDAESLQLPIYHLLVHNLQNYDVLGAAYWYIEQSPAPEARELPSIDDAHQAVLREAKILKTARKLGHFKCPNGESGCKHCLPLERILKGEGKQIGVSYNRAVYILPYVDDTMDFEVDLL